MRSILFLAAALVLLPGPSDADSRSYWAGKEAECRGKLAYMLRAIDAAGPIPQRRADRPASDLARALRTVGRFQQLGLSDVEGEHLVAAIDLLDRRDRVSNPTAPGLYLVPGERRATGRA